MDKKVFVSHSTLDKKIVSLFVDKILVGGCGLRQDDIMYTSCEDMGVGNGEDIPFAIKQGIQGCQIFLMMVSENYRKSEVCMNEMGAAWITDSINKRCTLLLPGVGFDRMGWLMSLSKANKLDEEEGLDSFHDTIVTSLGLPPKTGTWNKYRREFLSALQGMAAVTSAVPEPQAMEDENEDELDLLAIRERFESHNSAYVESLGVLAASMHSYSEQLAIHTQKLNRYNENPKLYSSTQVRGLFTALAKETNKLADIQNELTPSMRRHFDGFIKYAILLQGEDVDAEIKRKNGEEVNELIGSIKGAYSEISNFKDSMDGFPNLDKSFTQSKNRLKKSLEDLLTTLSFCIGRANEFLV